MTTITERLNEWRKLADAASEGPWATLDSSVTGPPTNDPRTIAEAFWKPEDAAFFAASREAVPALLDAVEKVLALCEEVDVDSYEAQQSWLVSAITSTVAEVLGVSNAE